MTGAQLLVGMAEIQIAKGTARFNCLGLGSCIGLVAHDRVADVTAMVHVMLPEAFPGKPVDKPGKYADTGITQMLKLLSDHGAEPRRLVVAYAGGAQVFKFGSGGNDRLDVGARNAAAVDALVRQSGLRVLATDTGGSTGRTVTVDSGTGVVKVRTLVSGERVLCNLKNATVQVAA